MSGKDNGRKDNNRKENNRKDNMDGNKNMNKDNNYNKKYNKKSTNIAIYTISNNGCPLPDQKWHVLYN